MPGHGRDNLQHELELGGADVCGPSPAGLTASALALLERAPHPAPSVRSRPRWEPAYAAALARVGLDLHPRLPVPQPSAPPAAPAARHVTSLTTPK
jgi:hypothetical protein